jgi:7-keto-8-aminopelargonate synthetase-like enzyme
MARAEKFNFSHERKIESAHRYVAAADQAGVLMKRSQSGNGRTVVVGNRSLFNFGSCSYLGLEHRPELREAAHRAIDDFGTQFSFSRAYLECSLYAELEAELERMTERHVLVSASTTLGHMAALPTLIKDKDVVVIDQFAHASLHQALQLLPKVPLEILRHNQMDQLEARLEQTAAHGGNLWYVADGLYSMLGDFAPYEQLRELLARYAHLRLYIDDAHATSCLGKHGRGSAVDHFRGDERVVVVLSLNKAFSAAGAALLLEGENAKTKIRRCGGPMLFSGPIQPPMLGAAVGSVRLHLSGAFPAIQAELHERVEHAARAITRTGMSVVAHERSPIFQAQCDSPRVVFAAHHLLHMRGYYCSVCVFPAVPMNRPGLRFTVSRHNTLEDIDAFIATLDQSIREAYEIVANDEDLLPASSRLDRTNADMEPARLAV